MLYFSKLRILFITLFSVLFILIASSNLFKFDDNFFDKKINLENKEEKTPCCNTEKSTELINDNLPAKKVCCSKKPF